MTVPKGSDVLERVQRKASGALSRGIAQLVGRIAWATSCSTRAGMKLSTEQMMEEC